MGKKVKKKARKKERKVTKTLIKAFENGGEVSVILKSHQGEMTGIVYKALREGDDMLFYLQHGPCTRRDTIGFFASDVKNLSKEPKWMF